MAPYWAGFVAVCSVHGQLPVIWATPLYAAWEAIGHASTHHA